MTREKLAIARECCSMMPAELADDIDKVLDGESRHVIWTLGYIEGKTRAEDLITQTSIETKASYIALGLAIGLVLHVFSFLIH